MCCILSEHFSGIFLFLCMIYYGPPHSRTIAYATSLNSSEEIKSIFSVSDISESVLKGAHGTGNFAEGGLINVNLTQSLGTSRKNLSENSLHHSHNISTLKGQNISFVQSSRNKFLNSSEDSTIKNLMPTKLTETGSNLFLGVPEVIHINGTSSIKPRKGVYYNKIVPRKGVDNDSETDLENQPCFQSTENECYDAKEIHNLECSHCKEGNILGKIVKKQNLVNCKNCKPINILLPEKQMFKNICCSSIPYDTHSSTTQDFSNDYKNYQTATSSQKEEQNLFNTHISDIFETASDLPKVTETKNSLLSSRKISKLKPSVTKVPYDVEVVTELLSKAQQKVFVPVVVSIFLLPLVGVLIYFLWRRTKEYWDKMYYKRMDFLIDGIYND